MAEIPTDGRHINYQRQYRECNKPTCDCYEDKSKRHGPYWYAFWKGDDGKPKSKYIGKVLPERTMRTHNESAKARAKGGKITWQ